MYYTRDMVQPKLSPTSLRIPEAIRAAVEMYAADRGIARNAAYVELLQRGLALAPAKPREPTLAERQLAEAMSKPRLQSIAAMNRAADQAQALHGDATNEKLHMPRAPIGSRLKKDGKK